MLSNIDVLGTNGGDVDRGIGDGEVDLGTGAVDPGVDGLILVGYNRTNFIHNKILMQGSILEQIKLFMMVNECKNTKFLGP